MNPSDTPLAPLPELMVQASHSTLRNSWRQLIATVPVHSERVRYNTTAPTCLPAAVRYPLRNGTLLFMESGAQIEGQAVVPSPALVRASNITQIILFVLYVVCAAGLFISALHPLRAFGSLFIFGGLLFRGVMAFVIERQRKPMEAMIPWNDVAGAQVDRNKRWITLFFAIPVHTVKVETQSDVVVTETKQYYFLSLNKLDAATIEGITETIHHFAPDSSFATVDAYEWTLGRKIAFGIVSIPITILFMLLCIFLWKVIFP